jgi:hypothetical protein
MPGYPSLELGFPGKPACPDSYTETSTLYCGGAGKLRLQASVAAIYLSFGVGLGSPVWEQDQPYTPVVGSIVRRFDAVRVRNFTAGVAAQVILIAEAT